MPVPRYLTQNTNRIATLPQQFLGAWNAKYDNNVFDRFPVVIELRNNFPNKIINRSDIVALFKNGDKYLGFLAAMVWGFIDASRPRVRGGDRTTTNLYRALSHPQKEVEDAIKNAEDSFKRNDYRTPFKEMMRGKSHNIPGIDYRYFTKIFFFIGQADNMIVNKPLIFDKWTSNAFFALLSQTHPKEVCKYFRDVKDAKKYVNPGEVAVRSGDKLVDAYVRFVELMNCWATHIGISPDKLEEFIFGCDLRNGNRTENPRMELWKIVDSNRHLVNCREYHKT